MVYSNNNDPLFSLFLQVEVPHHGPDVRFGEVKDGVSRHLSTREDVSLPIWAERSRERGVVRLTTSFSSPPTSSLETSVHPRLLAQTSLILASALS